MIKSFSIKNVATFDSDGVKFDGLKKANFILGANGTGKTTISNAFYNWNPNSGNSNFIIEGNINNTDILVYNKQFRKDNFKDSSNIPGVFTLGKNSIELEKEINDIEHQINVEENNKEKLNNDIDQLDNIIENNEKKFDNYLWKQLLQPNRDIFKSALHGYLNSKDKFKNRILESYQNKEIKCNLTLEELLEKNNLLFKSKLIHIPPISNIPEYLIKELEEVVNPTNTLLGEAIVASSNKQMSNLIEKLQNSDWVRSGMQYIEKYDTHCPFCQQEISQTIINNLKDVFDETYQNSIRAIKNQKEKYVNITNNLLTRINAFKSSSEVQENSNFSSCVDRLNIIIDKNKKIFDDKIKEASGKFEILSTTNIIQEIYDIVQSSNEKIKNNNELCENLSKNQESFKKILFSFLAQKEADKIEEYLNNDKKNNKFLTTMKQELTDSNTRIQDLNNERNELRKEITNIKDTAENVNSYLKSFGFNNFKLKANDNNSYSLVRNNDEQVKDTLSEGEITFITFLYYYHLINGESRSESSNRKKILIIDDPISSLDSTIQFIVSTLVKDIIKEVIIDKKEKKFIQLFVFTHNIHFYNEITSLKSVEDARGNSKKITFWIMRKVSDVSTIEKLEQKPVLSHYATLWREINYYRKVKDKCYSNNISVGNNMRRILEYYFQFLGEGKNILEKVEHEIMKQPIDTNKPTLMAIKSLYNWMNSSSHTNIDEINHIDYDIETYFEVFRNIFELSGHIAHYNMMIKNDCDSEVADTTKSTNHTSQYPPHKKRLVSFSG